MFLRRRATQAEYFDAEDRSPLEVAADYQQLARVNRLFMFSQPFERLLPRWLGEPRCQRLRLLDLGAGDGSLGQRLALWARRRGWHWRVTDLDKNPAALALSDHGNKVGASALSLPFPDGSFDLVIASQMTHHFGDAEVVQHWREAWRVAREAMLIRPAPQCRPVWNGLAGDTSAASFATAPG
jgi:ubiquinone/menaquinone biosynthesis C-methylase UbiE